MHRADGAPLPSERGPLKCCRRLCVVVVVVVSVIPNNTGDDAATVRAVTHGAASGVPLHRSTTHSVSQIQRYGDTYNNGLFFKAKNRRRKRRRTRESGETVKAYVIPSRIGRHRH